MDARSKGKKKKKKRGRKGIDKLNDLAIIRGMKTQISSESVTAGARTQHTPGPWWNDGFTIRSGSVDRPDNIAVAAHDLQGLNRRREQHLTNARLIASAPELLKIAKQMLAQYADLTDRAEAYRRKDWEAVIAAAEGK